MKAYLTYASPRSGCTGLVLALLCATAHAQGFSADREVDIVRTTFEVGNYKEALQRGLEAMASQNFSEAQRIELNKYAGISAFILGDPAGAEQHLNNLLELNPDYVLDPFAFPPPAIKFFEDLRKKSADALNLVRQKLALREEQLRREAADRLRVQAAAEEQRRRLEQLSAQVKTVEKRSFALNFLPFGAGQFQQGRTKVAVALASAEGVLGATSFIAFLALESMKEQRTIVLKGAEGDAIHTDTGIPPERQAERDTWRLVKYASGAAFYTVYAYGVFDAVYHHEDEVVTTTTIQVPPMVPRTTEPGPAPKRTSAPKPFLFPTAGGVGAGVTMSF